MNRARKNSMKIWASWSYSIIIICAYYTHTHTVSHIFRKISVLLLCCFPLIALHCIAWQSRPKLGCSVFHSLFSILLIWMLNCGSRAIQIRTRACTPVSSSPSSSSAFPRCFSSYVSGLLFFSLFYVLFLLLLIIFDIFPTFSAHDI